MRHGEPPLDLTVRANNSTHFMNFLGDKLIEPDQAAAQTKELIHGDRGATRAGLTKGVAQPR